MLSISFDIMGREGKIDIIALFIPGMALSGTIKKHLGFYGNFSLGISLIFVCILYTTFFLKVIGTLTILVKHLY